MARRRTGYASTTETISVTVTMLVLLGIAYFLLDGLAAIVLAAIVIAAFGIVLGLTARRGSSGQR